MSKQRVYEIAKQLNMDQKALVSLFQSMGVGDVRNHMSAVESDVVERVKRHLERQKTPDVVEERIRPTVVKRQRRATEEAPAPRPSAPGAVASPVSSGVPASPGSQARYGDARYAEEAPVRRRPPSAEPSATSSREAPAPAPSASSTSITSSTSVTSIARGVEATPEPARSAPRPSRSKTEANEAPPAMEMFEPPQAAEPAPSRPGRGSAAKLTEAAPVEAQARSSEARSDVAEARAVEAASPAIEARPSPPPEVAPPRPAVVPPPPVDAPPSAVVPVIPGPPPPPSVDPTRGMPAAGHTRVAPLTSHDRVSPPPDNASAAPRRPSQAPGAPKTGIETWQGRPGVPMPQQRTSPVGARRQVFDPRVATTPQRPGPSAYSPGLRPGQRPGPRPGQRPFMNSRMPPGPRKPAMVSTQEMSSHKKVVKIEEQVTLQQLAAKMSLKATDVLIKLLGMGMTGVHINSTLDADTAKILAGEFGWAVEDVAVSEQDQLGDATKPAGEADVETHLRPPIVTVMGHVDHGKTSLLDRIRKAAVADGEAGGITQHIGAYRVETARGTVAFLDTPGHEAFTEMRARGAKVTDIVILVVAADDGVMPQTREAIAHAQAAKVPIVVAVNKIDKPGADPEKIKRDLASLGLQPEEWGGQTMFREVSAKTGQGIDELLESLVLQAEVLELKANPAKRASGTVIEALLDRGRGPVARVMVQDGTLREGDILLAGGAWGKVRRMTDEAGRKVEEAGPSTPVEVLGLNEVPSAGDPVHAVKDARTAEEIADTRRKKASKTLIPQDSRISLDALADKLREADQLELKLIIKGDVQGSVEAVSHALAKLSAQKVKVTIVHAGVGGITEGDVNLAVASKAVIVGFNVRPAGKAASLAEGEGIEIRLYNIIYNAVDDIRAAMEGLLPATKVEKILGKAEVRQVFPIVKVGLVAGCMVLSGTIRRTADARLIRDSVVVWTGKLSGLRRFKDDAREVEQGFECGISLDGYRDIKAGDIVECFEIEEIKTKLS